MVKYFINGFEHNRFIRFFYLARNVLKVAFRDNGAKRCVFLVRANVNEFLGIIKGFIFLL